MRPSGTLAFDLWREQVEGMVREGEPLEAVDQMLDGAALPDDERAALWLLAWSLARERPLARRGAGHMASPPPLALVPVSDGP